MKLHEALQIFNQIKAVRDQLCQTSDRDLEETKILIRHTEDALREALVRRKIEELVVAS